MIQPLLNFFSSTLQCLRRTREQRTFEEKLYVIGLEKEEAIMIEKINETIPSEELAVKFVLQELDVARQGDTFSQNFVQNSGFHKAEYLGALKKFEEDREALEEVQLLVVDFLNKISNEKTMFKVSMAMLNGVMEHWEIGKYSEEGQLFLQDELMKKELPLEKSTPFKLMLSLKQIKMFIMEKLVYADDKIQDLLDAYALYKEKKKVPVSSLKEEDFKENEAIVVVKIYTEEKVNELMEEYSHIIEEIITGKINSSNSEEVEMFQNHMSLAAKEGNNLAFVFCAFFEGTTSFPITHMDDKSKIFFIEILDTFQKKGFSKSLHTYLQKNGENVYSLAKGNDKFMQYLMGFWYVWKNEDKRKIKEEQDFWYNQSALNGFNLAIEKMKK